MESVDTHESSKDRYTSGEVLIFLLIILPWEHASTHGITSRI